MNGLPKALLELMVADNHQIASDITLPCNARLMERVISKEQILAIANEVGEIALRQIAYVKKPRTRAGMKFGHPNYLECSRIEERDIHTLCTAISKVTGKEKPWITGFASQFAKGLLAVIRAERRLS